jgi:hypothetical protein
MPHLFLPMEHSDADLVLATQVAEAVDSDELFVVWSSDVGAAAAPEVEAVLREPTHPVAEAVVAVFQSVATLLAAFRSRQGAAR